MMMNNGMNGGLMMFMPIFFWILIITGLVLIVRWFISRNKGSALDILKQRYARGEIDSATFERIKKNINAGNRP